MPPPTTTQSKVSPVVCAVFELAGVERIANAVTGCHDGIGVAVCGRVISHTAVSIPVRLGQHLRTTVVEIRAGNFRVHAQRAVYSACSGGCSKLKEASAFHRYLRGGGLSNEPFLLCRGRSVASPATRTTDLLTG